MLFDLILVVVLGGQSFDYVIDEKLTRSECIECMLVMNKEFDTKNFKCEYFDISVSK